MKLARRVATVVSAILPLVAAAAVAATDASAQESTVPAARAKAASGDQAAQIALGRALRRAGRSSEAITELRRAVASRRSSIELRLELARAFIDSRDFALALAECRALLALPGGEAPGHACAAEAHLLRKRATDAHEEAALALTRDPSNVAARVAEARALALELKEKEAEALLRDVLRTAPTPEVKLELARVLLQASPPQATVDRRPEAIALLREVVPADPLDPDANLELGRALAAGPESVAALERAMRERPSYGAAAQVLAELHLAAGRVAEARKLMTVAMKSQPHEPATHVLSGRIALAENKPDDALAAARTALALLPNSAAARLVTADAWAAKKEVDLAVEQYEIAWGNNHNDPAPLVRASVACHAAGRLTSAKAFAEKATREFPTWAPGWSALGDALAAQKEGAAARTAYQTALKSKGLADAPGIEKKLAALK